MRLFLRLLTFLRPYRRGVAVSFVLAAAAMGMGVLIPYLVGRTVDVLVGPHHGQDVVEPCHVGGVELPESAHGRVVDERMETAELRRGGTDCRLDGVRVAQIAGQDQCLATGIAHQRRGLLERTVSACHQTKAHAVGAKPAGDGAPDAAARAGHDRHLPIQSKVSAMFLPVFQR